MANLPGLLGRFHSEPDAKAGDREIVVHHELDGPLQGFGTKFWRIVAKEHHGAMTQIEQSNADVVSISYSDRYLFSPLSLALLVDLVSRLKEVGQPLHLV